MVFSEFDVGKKYPGVKYKKKSDPAALRRVRNYTKPWFDSMQHQVERLGLLQSPRTRGEDKVLISYPPCMGQKLHWDFDPEIVHKLIERGKFEGVPISCLCSFTPTGMSLTLTLTLHLYPNPPNLP